MPGDQDSTAAVYGNPQVSADNYQVSDSYFGAAYIDQDEIRDKPSPHRFIHGGFEDTATRFAFYFPAASSYEGRMFQPLEGANGGNEVSFGGGMLGEMFQRIALSERMGGYMVESNQGHIGDDVDPRAGEDPGLYGWRASAESARFSKFIAAQVYGSAPQYSYVWGGSGGGRRSPLCLENAPDVWQGCMPSTSGGEIAEPGNNDMVRSGGPIGFGQMFNVQRLLGKEKMMAVVDAMAPGGSGDPFAGLTTHEREELARLYRIGYPRGNESMILEPMGQIWLWSSLADSLVADDPGYFEDFWSKPGYVGHDMPAMVMGDLIDTTATVKRIISPRELNEQEEFSGPEYQTMRIFAAMIGGAGPTYDMPYAVELEGVGPGYRLGSGVKILSGEAAGRQFYTTGVAGDLFACDGHGEANLLRFTGVNPGDKVQVDNRHFLAFCYYARHHAIDERQFDSLLLDDQPIYPQHPIPYMSPLMGNCYSGKYQGKLLWIHHTHDSSLWPANGLLYAGAVVAAQGEEAAAENFCLRWNENAEHGPPYIVPPEPNRASATRLIDFTAITEQSLADLVDWVEKGIKPISTNYGYADGKIRLATSAVERGGIQPVVQVTANGGSRAEVRVGEAVNLQVQAAVSTQAGGIVSVSWDFDGSGSFPFAHEGIDGRSSEVSLSTTHQYDKAGTYYVSAMVHSHRDGVVDAVTLRIPNVAQARVIVRE
jgi:PKD domain-containing protein